MIEAFERLSEVNTRNLSEAGKQMNEVNRTLYIPLYGKAQVSKKGIILQDPTAERIWAEEGFPVKGKSRSKWLSYNMAMRARVFDDWTELKLKQNPDALVLHIGCGLDSRCERVRHPYTAWVDSDFPEVIALRKKYYRENERYHMLPLDASRPEQIEKLPDNDTAIVVLEGLCMYLTEAQLHAFLSALQAKYLCLHVLMDVYTGFGARASRIKNPVNDVGVTKLYGTDDLSALLGDLPLQIRAEHSFTPARLVDELKMPEKAVFKVLFTGKTYRKIYRLYELESVCSDRKNLGSAV